MTDSAYEDLSYDSRRWREYGVILYEICYKAEGGHSEEKIL